MANEGYFRHPSVRGETVVFVSEDDLWSVALGGGVARRLTAGLGAVQRPSISPDGSTIAFTGSEEFHPEVFSMPSSGGQARRLTHLGVNSVVVGWTPDGDIVFRSDYAQPFVLRLVELHAIGARGGIARKLPYGEAHEIAFGPRGGVLLGRNTLDPARWKRYRGGTAGHLWIDARGRGEFRRVLDDLNGNIASPMWIGDRIYFLSDHEGIGNVYSAKPDGRDVRRHTDHGEYYARFAATDGTNIVYQHGAELWRLDPRTGASGRMDVEFTSPRTQRNRKFVDAERNMHGYSVHPEGHSVAVEARGRLVTMPLWEGAVREHGAEQGVRARWGQWLADGERTIAISDAGGEEALEVYGADGSVLRLDSLDLGHIIEVRANPKDANVVAVSNHRLELFIVDIATAKMTPVDRSAHAHITGLAWSADGAWLAYSSAESMRTRSIKVYSRASKKTRAVTRPEFRDVTPAFDPEGRYLYFISYRTFDPVFDAHFFDLGFPRGSKPYVITLRADAPSPFVPQPRGLGKNGNGNGAHTNGNSNGTSGKKNDDKKKDDEAAKVEIDFDGIEDRILPFPVPEGIYDQICGIGAKVLWTRFQIQGSLSRDRFDADERGTLEFYDLKQLTHEVLLSGVSDFCVGGDDATLVYRAGSRLRAIKAGERPDEKFEDDPPNRRSGWLDLGRIRLSVEPGAEWRQMFREAWRLQRDNFWDPKMQGIDWARVYARYEPLVEKVATRMEFSDLVWEMQGELGTSHAYEMFGDYRRPPAYVMGYLGADLTRDAKGRWSIEHIVRGDSWEDGRSSPLTAPGVNVREGETLLAINGRAVRADVDPRSMLVHRAGQMVELTIGDASGRKPRAVLVKTLREEVPARYREWVERNRALVHSATNGRVGYVHVPDMGPAGFSEFHRYYMSEVERDGLIVDVRFNGGGSVSQIILEKLARKRIGYDVKPWGLPEPYPSDSPAGPMVAITNEHAGSDGDIFSHCFKLMKLGPLVGKRTWGGVIGIWVRHHLVDGGFTTQPEFAFWFQDVGWGVENYGTDPDHDVDIRPQDYVAGRDPQMETALRLIQAQLKRAPVKFPDFSRRPSKRLPKLPKRAR
jgi:tricorn protease